MDDQTIRMLETTFVEFARGKEESASLFYERLFALDPSLRRLFVNVEMKSLATKLMAALGLVVGGLRDLSKVVPVLESLGARHVGYGVEEAHYQTVGTALIQTLALSFGDRFTPDIRAAWTGAYGVVSGVMIDAARRALAGNQAAE
ncbi:MAG: hemin receptor [Rhizobium sp.]|nr:hemin receptor [Rhizobium sp.]